jgi:D-alanine-D-alanine ligase
VGLRVFIAHNSVAPEDDPSTADVLDEADFVEHGLQLLGIPAERRPLPGPEALAALAAEARATGAIIFNLIESPPGQWWQQCAAAGTFELFGATYTGASSAALWLTTDKILTRAVLAAAGLPVAPGGQLDVFNPELLNRLAPPWILKPACEDASIGLEGNPLSTTRDEALARAAALSRRFPGQPILAEHFLPGREINVAVLEGPEGPEILPIAEMTYVDYPDDLPKVLGWEAKWDEGSFACEHTVRSFLDDPADEPLLEKIRDLVRRAWHLCGLTGYARIDLRLDEAGEPCILEVNGNPCIAAGAGFEASTLRAGLTTAQVIQRILDAAIRRASTVAKPIAQKVHPTVETPRGASPAVIRRHLNPADREPLEDLIRATGFFNPAEIDIALELIDDRLEKGDQSHYRFLAADHEGRLAGYACWGPIEGTQASVDLYWIAVHPDFQGQRIGAALLDDAEAWIAESGRSRVYVETSTREQYETTRAFYRARGYVMEAELVDFYGPGDGKAMFVKVV